MLKKKWQKKIPMAPKYIKNHFTPGLFQQSCTPAEFSRDFVGWYCYLACHLDGHHEKNIKERKFIATNDPELYGTYMYMGVDDPQQPYFHFFANADKDWLPLPKQEKLTVAEMKQFSDCIVYFITYLVCFTLFYALLLF